MCFVCAVCAVYVVKAASGVCCTCCQFWLVDSIALRAYVRSRHPPPPGSCFYVQIKVGASVPQCLDIAWAALDAFYAVSTDYDPVSKAVAINDLDATDGLLDAFFAVGGHAQATLPLPPPAFITFRSVTGARGVHEYQTGFGRGGGGE